MEDGGEEGGKGKKGGGRKYIGRKAEREEGEEGPEWTSGPQSSGHDTTPGAGSYDTRTQTCFFEDCCARLTSWGKGAGRGRCPSYPQVYCNIITARLKRKKQGYRDDRSAKGNKRKPGRMKTTPKSQAVAMSLKICSMP